MFSLRICGYSMGKLMIEDLKMVKSVKFIQIIVPRDACPPGKLKKLPGWPGLPAAALK